MMVVREGFAALWVIQRDCAVLGVPVAVVPPLRSHVLLGGLVPALQKWHVM